MAVFNITDTIVFGGRPAKEAMISWLSTNVGLFYGVGDETRGAVAVGAGWEIRVAREIDTRTDDLIINWVADITDEAKSTHFALVWIK